MTPDLRVLVGRIDAKTDLILSQTDSHSKRLTELETWKNRVWGVVLAVGALAGGLGAKLAPILTTGNGPFPH